MNRYMEEADRLAAENLRTNHGGPFGAVVVRDGEIIGRGNNHVLANNDPTAHAEVMAIRDACKNISNYDLSGCELYTSCYPCPMCLSAIIWSNIRRVYYGNTKEDAAAIGFRDDFIYQYLGSLPGVAPKKDEGPEDAGEEAALLQDTLELIPMDREQTILTFERFAAKEDKTIY